MFDNLQDDVKAYAKEFAKKVKSAWKTLQVNRHRDRYEDIHRDFLDAELEITRKLKEVPKNSKEQSPPPPPPNIQPQPMEEDVEILDEVVTKRPTKYKKRKQSFVERVRYSHIQFGILMSFGVKF